MGIRTIRATRVVGALAFWLEESTVSPDDKGKMENEVIEQASLLITRMIVFEGD